MNSQSTMKQGMTAQDITLGAEDGADLDIISARLQDAVARIGDLVYLPKSQRFAALFNRFRWEAKDDTRIRSGLHFEHVTACKSLKLRRDNPDAVVSLLAIRFTPKGDEDPGGTVELIFSGGGALKLEVECVEAELADISGEWAATRRPSHKDAD